MPGINQGTADILRPMIREFKGRARGDGSGQGARYNAGTQNRPPKIVVLHDDINDNCTSVKATPLTCTFPKSETVECFVFRFSDGDTLTVNTTDVALTDESDTAEVNAAITGIEAEAWVVAGVVFVCGEGLDVSASAGDVFCTRYKPQPGDAYELDVSALNLVNAETGFKKGDILRAVWHHRCGYLVSAGGGGGNGSGVVLGTANTVDCDAGTLFIEPEKADSAPFSSLPDFDGAKASVGPVRDYWPLFTGNKQVDVTGRNSFAMYLVDDAGVGGWELLAIDLPGDCETT